MFSVIIPLYNKERHIVDAVQSVLRQTYKKFEIIIVNDGSTDNSLNSLAMITDSRVKIISQKNAGVSAARNRGIENSKFDYLAFLDADDVWESIFLEEIIELIDVFPSAGWFATGYAYKEFGKVTEFIPHNLKGKKSLVDFFKYSIFDLLIHIGSTVIKRSSFDKVGVFPESVIYGEDQDLFARLALNYALAYSGKVGVYYNQDSDNRACLNIKLTELWPFLKEYNKLLHNKNLTNKDKLYINEFITRRMLTRAKILKSYGEAEKAIKLLMKYKDTVLLKKMWIKSFIFCLLPYKILRKMKYFQKEA